MDNSSRKSTEQVNVVRRVYLQDALNTAADYHSPNKRRMSKRFKKFSRLCGLDKCVYNALPIRTWLPKYNVNKDLFGDIMAGSTTAVMQIPQGMAYAMLAEVPPVVGLYTAFFPVMVYILLCTSPHVSQGTFAISCLMIGKIVKQYSNIQDTLPTNTTEIEPAISGGPYTPLQVISIVAFTVGSMQIMMWVLRLGIMSTLLSEPLVSGFTSAAGFHVVSINLKDFFGIPTPKPNTNIVLQTVWSLIENVQNTNWTAFTISTITCIILILNSCLLKPWVAKRSRVPVPIELLTIVIGTLVAKFNDLGVTLIGLIPTGLPTIAVPPVELFASVALDCLVITMVTYTITMSLVLIFATKEKCEIDANQELLALGAANMFGSFFTCLPICASLSRSNIQYQAGSKTPITSLVSALWILLIMLWIGPFFQDLPRCILASIIIVSLRGMVMQVTDLPRFCSLSKLDAVVWLVAFLITVLVNIDVGLLAGLLASIGTLFIRSQRPYTCVLGRVLDTDIYLDIKRYRAAVELPGIKIFHYCGGLNFASKNHFREALFRKVGYMKPLETQSARPVETSDEVPSNKSYVWDPTFMNRVRCVIIDATALSYVDAPGLKALVSVQQELTASKITVLLCGANVPVLEMINTFNALEKDQLKMDMFPTVHDAVVYFSLTERQADSSEDSSEFENSPDRDRPRTSSVSLKRVDFKKS